MAEETINTVETNFTEKGLDELSKKLEKIQNQYTSLNKSVSELISNIDKLGNAKTIKVDTPNSNVTQVKVPGYGSLNYNPNRKNARETGQPIIDDLNEAIKVEIENRKAYSNRLRQATALLEKEVANYESNLSQKNYRNETNRITAEAYAQKQKDESGWRQYKSANASHFDPTLQRNNRSVSNALMSVGNTFNNMGSGGKIIGGIADIAGAFASGGPWAAAAAAVVKLTTAVTDFTKNALQSYGQIESIKTQLGVVYGSDSQAANAFNEISKYAVKSPFGVQQTSEMAVLLKQSGVYASDLMDTLKMIGDTAGGNAEKMKRIANNYAQIVSIGKASMLDMRQFAYAGIPIFEKVADELGVSQARLRSMVSDGKVTSEVIEKVFEDMTSEDGLFYGATAKGAETYKARMQNLNDTKQLAMASVGQTIMNIGDTDGTGGIVSGYVHVTQSLWEKLKNWAAIKNIEHDVNIISTRTDEYKHYQEIYEYAKKSNDKSAMQYYLKKMEELDKLKDPDKERELLNSSYEIRGEKWLEYKPVLREAGVQGDKKSKYQVDNETIYKKLTGDQKWDAAKTAGNAVSTLGDMSSVILRLRDYDLLGAVAGVLRMTTNGKKTELSVKDLLNISDIAKFFKETEYGAYFAYTNQELFAHQEFSNMMSQSNASDSIEKFTDSSLSIINDANQIREILESSEEYRQREQEKLIARLEESRNLLKEISQHTLEGTDIIDIKQISGEKLQKWITQGALTAQKLAIVQSDKKAGEQWRQLAEQTQTVRFKTQEYYGKILQDGNLSNEDRVEYENMANLAESFLEPLSAGKIEKFLDPSTPFATNKSRMDSFYEYYTPHFYEAMESVTKELETATAANDSLAMEFWESIKNDLEHSTFSFSVDAEGLDGDLNVQDTAKTKEFIPLWRRILSSATGIPVDAVLNTSGTLNAYKDNYAVRNMSSNMIQTMLTNGMGFAAVRDMITTKGVGVRNREDTGTTYQIDWKSVKDNLKQFALSLSASTTIIDSYKSSLDSQYQTYIALAQGIITPESEEVGSLTTWEDISKIIDSGDSALINAFGESMLTTENGEVARLIQDIDGTYKIMAGDKDVTGQQLRLGGKLFDFLEEQIPALRKDIQEANKQSAYNEVYSKLTGDVSTEFLNRILLYNASDISGYASLTQDMKDIFVSSLKENLKSSELLGSGEGKYASVEDLIIAALNGTDNNASTEVNNFASELLNASDKLELFSKLMEEYNNNAQKEAARKNVEQMLPYSVLGDKRSELYSSHSFTELLNQTAHDYRFTARPDFEKVKLDANRVGYDFSRIWKIVSDKSIFEARDSNADLEALKKAAENVGSRFSNIGSYLKPQWNADTSLLSDAAHYVGHDVSSILKYTFDPDKIRGFSENFWDTFTDPDKSFIDWDKVKDDNFFTGVYAKNLVTEDLPNLLKQSFSTAGDFLNPWGSGWEDIKNTFASVGKEAETLVTSDVPELLKQTYNYINPFDWDQISYNIDRLGDKTKDLLAKDLPRLLLDGIKTAFGWDNLKEAFIDFGHNFTMWLKDTFNEDNIMKQADAFGDYVNNSLFSTLLEGAGLDSSATYDDMLLYYRDLMPANMLTSLNEQNLYNELNAEKYKYNYGDLMNSMRSVGLEQLGWTGKEALDNHLNAEITPNGDVRYVAKSKDYEYKLRATYDGDNNPTGFEAEDPDDKKSEEYAILLNQNLELQKQLELKKQLADEESELYGRVMETDLAYMASSKTMKDLGEQFSKLALNAAEDSWLTPFKTMGECLITGDDAAESLGENMKAIAANLLSQVGTYMAQAGFSLVAYGAKSENLAMIAGGLGLAAAGGFASGLGGALNSSDTSKTDDQTAKLESLKDQLQKLLEQARTDALYYENNLRHKTAVGINAAYSNKSVNDAIIAPNGNVITTAPDDYLIATKTPGSLKGSSNVNVTINNNSSARVDIQRSVRSDGTVDLVAQVYDVMDSYIASERSDQAFTARQFRINGHSAVR